MHFTMLERANFHLEITYIKKILTVTEEIHIYQSGHMYNI